MGEQEEPEGERTSGGGSGSARAGIGRKLGRRRADWRELPG